MRHVLACFRDESFVDALRADADASTTFLVERDPEEALERVGRSARIDAVLTDDASLVAAIREEIPGALPVRLVTPAEGARDVLLALERMLSAP